MTSRRSRTFEPNDARTVTAARGQLVHGDVVSHMDQFVPRLHAIGDRAWCVVGNGLSNQTFIEAPDGIIAIDTGECVEEMAAAIALLRNVTSRPFAAVIYTHFHYVNGTTAVFSDAGATLPVWGHARIGTNRSRTASAIAPAYTRGLVEQFGTSLPADGPDGLVGVGLGTSFKNSAHAPHTPGYVAAQHTFDTACHVTIAGLDMEVTPAPSDADDSVTIWIPSLGVAVNNLVWPVLFNVFAIRGEEYRDPTVLLTGLDHLSSLHAEHLIGAHGVPISGREDVARRVQRYRDAIQFLWDQTVRHTNRGATSSELAHLVRLPDWADDDYLTTEFYGVAEHHTRQIRSGLFGFFDGNESQLFPLPTNERNDRFLAALGGRDEVRKMTARALDTDDVRWALELASMLARSTASSSEDHVLVARVLRTIASRTTAANIRNWCLTRARQWDGTQDGSRLTTHRFSRAALLAGTAADAVHVLRVLVDPNAIDGIDALLSFNFADHGKAGLHVRNNVCVPTTGSGASHVVTCSMATWAALLTGTTTLSEAIAAGDLTIDGDTALVRSILSSFDPIGLRS